MAATVNLTVNASGAAAAAQNGQVVVIVDVIDMSTTCEAALDAGALAVYGAAPDNARCPVQINPQNIGEIAGRRAVEAGTDIVLVAEPRVGSDSERLNTVSKVVSGIKKSGARVGAVLPNLGAETAKLADLKGRVLVAATGTGGVAYDAAVTAGAPAVLTATVARTMQKKGVTPAREGARRALAAARDLNTGITVVAATANSLEDILAAEYLVKLIIMGQA
ncbi:hypothetical protein JOC37_001080 [Desulfohalotomaculum tongense]|uniref:hypothetical protein n=1 Tax=Desulforadius tongensis TaxID=1216062 RepID=UPI0019563C52|nr:hypothetical protein [Desulforadius tongensis]MBM7854702.1 hypothetical protein [Desulforadius tongensis]